MWGLYAKRFIFTCMATAVIASCFNQRAYAVTIQFDALPPVFAPNVAGVTILPIAAAANVGGNDWDISAADLILTVVPGPLVAGMATSMSATLTLTGVNGNPFVITYDPVGGNGNDNVTISFGSAPGLAMAGFAPIVAPVADNAALDGTIIGPGNLFPASGVKLNAFAVGAGQFGIIAPPYPVPPNVSNGNTPGAFAASIGPIPEPTPPVTNISGTLSFRFGGTATGEVPLVSAVQFPNSATVESEGGQTITPEPGTWWLLVIGFAALVGYTRVPNQHRHDRGGS
jgi:hypothetical protein